MDNLLDLDHMTIDRSPMLVNHAAGDLNKPVISCSPQITCNGNLHADNAAISRSSSLGNEMQSLNVDNTNSDAENLVPLRTDANVEFAPLFKEGYYNKPEFLDHRNSTDIMTNDTNAGDNTQEEEKLEDEEGPQDEGWIGGMFDFSEEGKNPLNQNSLIAFLVLTWNAFSHSVIAG